MARRHCSARRARLSGLACSAILLVAPRARAGDLVPSNPDRGALWTWPLASLVTASGSIFYLAVGGNIPMARDQELFVELTLTRGGWYGCRSESTGAWLMGGWSYFPGRRGRAHGFFVAPRVSARVLRSTGAEATGGILGCSQTDADNVDGDEADLMMGADLGYRFRWRRLLLEPVVGASAGYCLGCPAGGPFSFGGFDLFGHEARENRPVLAVNVQLLRLGVSF
jgi:hypothetical protein